MSNGDVFAERFGELVGRGAQAAVYARDDVAVKVYRAGYPKAYVFYEAMIMSYIETTALPIAKVHEVLCVNGQMAIRMSRVTGRSLNAIMTETPDKAPEILDRIVALQRQIHEKRVFLPVRLKDKLRIAVGENSGLDAGQKKALLRLCETLPEGDSLCHGDFHGDNILFHDGAYALIDWIDASTGCAAGDACRTYLDYSLEVPEIADLYLNKYCAATDSKKENVLRWLPVQAGSMLGAVPEKYNKRLWECIRIVEDARD